MQSIELIIVQSLSRKEPRAIELIFQHYGDTLYGVIQQMVHDDELAKDILQDSLVKYWKKADTYDASKARLFTWLLRIARNTAIDAIRKKKRKSGDEIQMPDSVVHIPSNGQWKPEEMDIRKHLATLDCKYQEVLHALFFLGMTQQEVSEELEIPLGTVKTRLRIGLRELRKIYGPSFVLVLLNWMNL